MVSCCDSCRSATRKRCFRSSSGWWARAPNSGGSGRGEARVDGGRRSAKFGEGGGEVGRAVLRANRGGRPEGLPEPMQELLGKYRSLLPAPDLVRLLA